MRTVHRGGACALLIGAILSFFVAAAAQEEKSRAVFDRMVEAWKWNQYWYGTSSIADVYIEGRSGEALVFWARREWIPKMGLCSSDLGFCVVLSNPDVYNEQQVIAIPENTPVDEAFKSFVEAGFNRPAWPFVGTAIENSRSESTPANSQNSGVGVGAPIGPAVPSQLPMQEQFGIEDYETERLQVTLPHLGLPDALTRRDASGDKLLEAEAVKEQLVCRDTSGEARPGDCGGELIFAFREKTDPFWWILRRCTASCDIRYPSMTVFALAKGGGSTWWATTGTMIRNPRSEVERLARLIENAQMFRLPL